MKSFVTSMFFFTMVLGAGTSYVQKMHSLSRADVRAELNALEKTGYRPVAGEFNYPNDIQAAEMKLSAQSNRQK